MEQVRFREVKLRPFLTTGLPWQHFVQGPFLMHLFLLIIRIASKSLTAIISRICAGFSKIHAKFRVLA
jgi:hypothetical protein